MTWACAQQIIVTCIDDGIENIAWLFDRSNYDQLSLHGGKIGDYGQCNIEGTLQVLGLLIISTLVQPWISPSKCFSLVFVMALITHRLVI
mmetsp:Transcript_27679/g.49863  ORF Transcript_27679/g.49863 Transcript_27679/m.49863 type:complete len:90 (+) Transcript_27679:239-508(+)